MEEKKESKVEIIGVRFKKAGKVYYFDPKGESLGQDDAVIVETARGIELGAVAIGNRLVDEKDIIPPLKQIIRKATNNDREKEAANRAREADAVEICTERIAAHNLGMKLVDVEMTFDQSKIVFYFTADGRVDFRELVKDLTSALRMRIELRQIGVRDEAKALNSVGICGRTLCCATFLEDFQPVSIKMAKEQNLSLNPMKISGVCGRLMCCLKYEEETYEYLNKNLPNVGDNIRTPDGEGEVLSVGVLRQLVRAAVRKKQQDVPVIGTYHVDDVKVLKRKFSKSKSDGDSEDLKEILD